MAELLTRPFYPLIDEEESTTLTLDGIFGANDWDEEEDEWEEEGWDDDDDDWEDDDDWDDDDWEDDDWDDE